VAAVHQLIYVLGEGVSPPHDQMPSTDGGGAGPPKSMCHSLGAWGGGGLDVHPPRKLSPVSLTLTYAHEKIA
jgi:hypothetical protein